MLHNCCCFRLRTAGLILGWLGVVGSVLMVIIAAFVLGNLDTIMDRIKEQQPVENVETLRTFLLIVSIAYIVLAVINFVTCTLLIYGTVKERHRLLLPWLIVSGISLGFSIIYLVYYFFALISMGQPFLVLLIWLIFAGLGLAMQFYLYYAIYSLYKELQSKRVQGQNGSSNPYILT